MLHWLFRSGSPVAFLPWLGAMLAWWIGGWGLLGVGFRWPRRKDRAIVAWGAGLSAYLFLVNILGRWLPPLWGFGLPAAVVLFVGLWVDRPVRASLREFVLGIIDGWKVWLAFAVIAFVFLEIEFGLLLFDEYRNIPLISVLAAGDIPPHNFFAPQWLLAYHYAFHLLGASLVRLGDLFPWTAFDVSKAMVFAYGMALAWLLAQEYLSEWPFQWLFMGAYALAGGTRYLLLLLPQPLTAYMNRAVTLWGATAEVANDFQSALSSFWTVSGGPPLTWPIAFLSGMRNPQVMVHGASLPLLLLVWLLLHRLESPRATPLLVLILSLWALTSETTYALVVIGTLIWALWQVWKSRFFGPVRWWALAVLVSLPVSLVQGGTLTQAALQALARLHLVDVATPPVSPGSGGLAFSIRWPPAIVSAHLGELSLFNPLAWVVAIAEIGVGILLLPWLWNWVRGRIAREAESDLALAVFTWGGLIGFVIPVFVRYAVDRDITLFMGLGLGLLTLLLPLAVGEWYNQHRWGLVQGAVVSLVLMMVPGIVLGGASLSAVQRPDFAMGISRYDVEVAREVWDQLPSQSLVFGGWHAVAITGRPTRVGLWINQEDPEYKALAQHPSLQGLLSAGYTHLYVEHRWWYTLKPDERADLSRSCVKVVAESVGPMDSEFGKPVFRRLLDLQACNPVR